MYLKGFKNLSLGTEEKKKTCLIILLELTTNLYVPFSVLPISGSDLALYWHKKVQNAKVRNLPDIGKLSTWKRR